MNHKTALHRVAGVLFRGLFVVVPIAVTLYAVWWIGGAGEKLVEWVLVPILPERGWLQYRPGFGLLFGLAIVLGVGLLTHVGAFRRVVLQLSQVIDRIPVVGSVYGGIRDLFDLLGRAGKQEGIGRPVSVELFDGCRLVGFLSQSRDEEIPDSLKPGDRTVAVYLPMSYQLGGYTVFVPGDRVAQIDMRSEKAMRYVFTAAAGNNGEAASSSPLGESTASGEAGHERDVARHRAESAQHAARDIPEHPQRGG